METDDAKDSLKQFAAARDIAWALVEAWESNGDSIRAGRRNRSLTPGQFTLIHSLAAHTHYLARPTLDLFDSERGFAALPLVRSMYECSITAQWVAQVKDSADAFVNEDVRQRRNLNKTLAETKSLVLRDTMVYGANLEAREHSAGEAARKFQELCESLEPGGADAYAYYRLLSMQTHASVMVADHYIDPNVDDNTLPTLRRTPNHNAHAYVGLVASSLVWAGRALDYCDMDNRRRSELRAAARELGISSELKLTRQAWLESTKRKGQKV